MVGKPRNTGRRPVGKDFDVQEPAGEPAGRLFGGEVEGWEPLEKGENVRMRGLWTKVAIPTLPLVLLGGLVALVLGANPVGVAAVSTVMAGLVGIILRYYFNG